MNSEELQKHLKKYTDIEEAYLRGVSLKEIQEQEFKRYPKIQPETYLFQSIHFIPAGMKFSVTRQDRFSPVRPHCHDYIEINYVYSGICSQTILLKENRQEEKKEEQDFGYLSSLEFLAKNKKYESLQKEIENLIREWGKEEHPQIWMEGRLRQICYLLQRYEAGNSDYRECEFLLDEAFANVENVDQLALSIGDIFFKDKKDETVKMAKIDTENYFDKIRSYIQVHMSEPLSLQKVSKDMGVSQTYLSKMFRKYEASSFNNYLTLLRIEKAKKLFREEEKPFVKEVAERVGYKDQFYFSRIFYAYTGVRPSEYMEQNHQNEKEV